jgi:hypothetical protein
MLQGGWAGCQLRGARWDVGGDLKRQEEENVHHAVEKSFESLYEDRLHTWLRAKNNSMKAGYAVGYPHFLANGFDKIREIWMTAIRVSSKLGASSLLFLFLE